MTDTLHQEPERDQFKSESPIRAFTDWQVNGRYALGKGFRPSLQHVVPYLEAMERKEGWRVVQVLEAGTQTPSFLFRLEREPSDDELRERYSHLDFQLPAKVATGLRQVTGDMVHAIKGTTWPHKRKEEFYGFADRVNGYAAELEAGEEPFVRNREGFEEAGRKIDQARDMAAGMERTEINGHLAFVFRGLDSETTFWNRARWNGKPEEAMKAMASMKGATLGRFLDDHKVDSVAQFWRSASVAAVLRLIDKLDWWDRVSLADPITHDELAKALGRTPPASAIAAMSADPYKAVADFIRDQPLGETYQADRWTDHGSHIDIPVEYHEEALRFIAEKRGMDADRLVKDFMLYFKERNQPNQVTHKTFYQQLQFILPAANPLELKQLIDQFRVSKQSPVEVTSAPPVSAIGDDPINPKHYAGRECADIGERLSANGYQILKYCWRLGKKDDPCQELGKAIWYGESEAALLKAMAHKQGYRHTTPNVTGIKDPAAFLEDRIADQPQFTQNIARMLWAGYSQRQLQAILEAINEHRFHLDCGRGLAI